MFSLGSSSILSLCSLTSTLVNNKSCVTFFVNNKKHTIDNPFPHMFLSEYLRESLNMKGTKIGCGISECGACSVVVSRLDKKKSTPTYEALNSCSVPVCSLDGASVITVEALGNSKKLHPIQKELVDEHAIQCGFCTPGIEMGIYASLKEQVQKDLKEESEENRLKAISKNLNGNLCRCTGYRPIFTALEKMVKNPEMYSADIFAFPTECKNFKPQEISIEDKESGLKWMTPTTLDSFLKIKEKQKNVNVVFSNSWLGPQCKERCDHRDTCADCTKKWGTYVYARNIDELRVMEKSQENKIVLGSQNTITEIFEFFDSQIKNSSNAYECRGLKAAKEMIGMFGSRPKRNGCTLEEAIMDCHPQNDINTMLTGLGARIVLMNTKKEIRRVPAAEFFATGGPKGKSQFRRVARKSNEILFGVELPMTKEYEFVKVFKQSRRRENDQAIVNSCIRVNFAPKIEGDKSSGYEVKEAAIAFGGVAITTARAKKAEAYLAGKSDFDSQVTLNEVIRLLIEEFPLDDKSFGGMAKYRASLMISAYFKFYLSILEELYNGSLKAEEKSAIKQPAQKLPAKGFQTYEEPEKKLDPIGVPHHILAAKTHVTGESVYIDDMRHTKDELEAIMVLSKRPNAKIKKVDYSKALKMKGVFGWVDSKDIPEKGSNLFALVAKDEKVFYDDYAPSYGLCVGVILAENKRVAQIARDAVKIEYEEIEKPLLTIEDGMEKKSVVGEPHPVKVGNPEGMFKFMAAEENKDKYLIMEGEMNIGGQEHLYIETNGVRAVPGENDEMKVFAGTQNVTEIQRVVSDVLGVQRNRVVCHAKRVGGSFGAKEEKPSILAAIAAVCAYKHKRPVRLVLDRYTDVTWSGQRHAYYAKYKIGVEKATGKIQAMFIDFFNNAGCTLDLSDGIMHKTVTHCTNSYHIPNVHIVGVCCKTNTISNTAFRGFGAPQGMITVDTIVDNLAHELGMDPMELKEKNFYSSGDIMPCHQMITENPIPNLWEECKKVSEFNDRRKKVEEFNSVNKWVKRGIYMSHVKYAPYFSETKFLNQGSALVCIYRDGSVIVSHGGHEMGQGLYTKVAQVAAYELGCPLSNVYLEDTASDKTPNVPPTAASSGSDINSAAVKNACDKLNARLAPIRAKLGPNATFKDIANVASLERISLSATGFFIVPAIWFDKETGTGVFPYFTHGVGCSEVEVDTLTGDYKILRSDIVMDIGRSLNPGLDIGQIEGGFMQAVGLFTQEELVKGDSAHPWLKQGKFWSNSPAKYKIPAFDDAPNVVNVHLLKQQRNTFAIHGSRAIGEPSLYLGSTVYFAIKDAVRAARKDLNPNEKNFRFDTPATCERIRMSCADPILKDHVLGDEMFNKYKVKGTY